MSTTRTTKENGEFDVDTDGVDLGWTRVSSSSGRMDPHPHILRLRRPAPDRFIQIEGPFQALVPHLGLQEEEEPVIEVGVIADRTGVEVEDQLLLELGLAFPLRGAITAEVVIDQRGLAGPDHAQDAEGPSWEGVVPEEGVQECLVGMFVVGLLDLVFPGAVSQIEAAENLGLEEMRMIGAVRGGYPSGSSDGSVGRPRTAGRAGCAGR